MKLIDSIPPQSDSIAVVSRQVWERERSCVEVVEHCLRRIDELESQVRAWVLVDRSSALEQARRMDQDLAAGRWHGGLHGIPIGIKDIVDVAGMPTACGWPRWANRIANEDAVIVQRLKHSGAIILGKTVTTQFAGFDPPVTRNPWNLNHTPGGSSSGSAAAVACGMCLGAIGSQTGGSITRPASFCGVAGCKPSHGEVNAKGIMPLAPSMDHSGPIAQNVRDLAILIDEIHGRFEGKGSHLQPHPEVGLRLDTLPSQPPRLGRLRGIFEERANPSMLDAFDRALTTLVRAGATVSEPQLAAKFTEVLRHHRVIMATEAAAEHRETFVEHKAELLPRIRELIEEGMNTSEVEYLQSLHHKRDSRVEFGRGLGEVDVIVTPATTGPAPDTSTTGDPAFNSPWSYTGLPTVSFPIGFSPDGLPLAIQFVGKAGNDGLAELFRVAYWCEQQLQAALLK